MPQNASREAVEKEGRIELAINAIKHGQIPTVRAAARIFDVSRQTLGYRLKGRVSRQDQLANGRKLGTLDEELLKNWIIEADERGLPPRFNYVKGMASILSQSTIGKHWVSRFIERHEEVRSCYTRQYDYQRALCEDPKIIQDWFRLVQNMIAKYGIHNEDIYNFDETGFAMGIISTIKVNLPP